MVSDPVLRVDSDVLQLLAGRLQGLVTRLSSDGDLLSPSPDELGAAAVVEAYEHLAARWQVAGAALSADVRVAVRHLSTAVDEYSRLERALGADALDAEDAQATSRAPAVS